MASTNQAKRKPEDSDFCYFPFFEIMMTAEGKFKPCSKHGEFISDGGEIVTVENGDIERAWNSDYMRELRENFRNNVRSNGCRECWRQQEMGLKEMRYDSYAYDCPESQVDHPEMPLRVEINASNICNLRCRICMPTASHKWIREAKELYGWEETVHFNMTPRNAAAIRQWVPHLTEIGFFGGEPLSAEENIDLLRHCVETGHSKHIDILLNTNGTVCSDELIDLFSQFRHVRLNFSIDDIGERFEYQRKGAKWDDVIANMKRYIAAGGYTEKDTIECKICCSVSNMNIYYFPEYFAYMNTHFPGLPVYWNLIYEPWEFSVEILPDEVKEVIRGRLRNFVSTTYEMSPSRTKTIDDLITFLDNRVDRDFSKFFVKIDWHDRYRKEDFSRTFPEFWQLIEKYRPESIPAPQTHGRADSNEDGSGAFDRGLDALLAEVGDTPPGRFVAGHNAYDLFERFLGLFDLAIEHFGFDRDEESSKHEMLRGMFRQAEFDRPRFLSDMLRHGLKRIVHLVHQNNETDLYHIIAEKYMNGYVDPSGKAARGEAVS